jgi:hypothetical protein
MAKNLLGKSRTMENPYATFEGDGPFGDTTLHLLKTYQKPENELKNQYGRWFVAVKTDHTFGSFDMGDNYISEVVSGLKLTFASDEFKENYWDQLDTLKQVTGFRTI